MNFCALFCKILIYRLCAWNGNIESKHAVVRYERPLLAEKLWNLYHDLSEEAREAGYLSCLSEIKGNGFPEETRRLTEQLSDPAFRQTLKEEYAAF